MTCKTTNGNGGPGKSYRVGLSTREFFNMFPDDDSAEQWFINHRWPTEIACPVCGSVNVLVGTKRKRVPFRCREKECGKQFSTKTGTFMECSKIGYQTWLFAMYLIATNLKGVSSMKLHRELGVTQKTAWHLAHRIRKAWANRSDNLFGGPVEVDETYMGGKRRNMHRSKRREFDGRGPHGKTAVVGIKDRETNQVSAEVIENTRAHTLTGFINRNIKPWTPIYTDDATAYYDLPNHESVKHSVGEYVRKQVHTQGVESFWAVLKRAHKGTFHRLSPKHLQRYIDEFVGRHNMRPLDTLKQMGEIARRMERAQLRYRDLVG